MNCYNKKLALLAFSVALSIGIAHGQSQSNPPAQGAAAYMQATRYDVQGRVTATISPDPDGGGALGYPATRNTYGADGAATAGMLVKVENGQLTSWQDQYSEPQTWSGFQVQQTKLISYDDRARKSKETLIGQNGLAESAIQYSYDSWDRLRCKAVRMNPAAFDSTSDACQIGPQGSFGADRITRYTYDSLGQLLTEERAVGTPLAQTYVTNTYGGSNPPGVPATKLLRTQTDANGNRTELEYDTMLRLKKRIYPSPTSAGAVNSNDYNEYQYDANGNVIYERKRNTKTITYEYDGNNRLVFKNLSDNTYSGDIAYNYDLRGLTLASCYGTDKLDDDCQEVAGGEGESNTFDDFGNVEKRTSTMGGVKRSLTYAYDNESNRLRVTHPDGYFFQYGFDGLNRLNSLAASTNPTPASGTSALLTIDYLPTGSRNSISRTGGAVTTIEVDNALRLKSFKQDFSGTTNDLTNGFAYNNANQVVSLTQSNVQYNYTLAQNRVGGYGVNGLNQYTQIDGEALQYDAAGNLTQDRAADGQLITYTYDMENHLVSAAGPVASTLKYDTLGRLSRITLPAGTTQFLYDGDAMVAEYLGGTLSRRYVHGDQVDEPLVQYNGANLATRRYLHADHQGSVIAQSDSTSAVTQKNAYDPYGIPAAANDGRFGYTGQTWLKELGLNYYKARIYSPRLGRFLQTDPIFYADSMNIYAYVGNDPLNLTDPSGLMGSRGCGACTNGPTLRDVGSFIADFIPVVGDIKGIGEAIANPTAINIIAAGVGIIPVVGDVAGKALKTGGNILQNSDVVVRGGAATPNGGNSIEGIAAGTGTHPSGVTGFSAEASPGASVCDLCVNVPQNQVGVTTVGDVRAAGGDVVPTSGRSPNHVTVTGVSPENANKLLTPTQPNPIPPNERNFR